MDTVEYETDLHRNPFAVLGATTRDSRARILELAEERSLLIDPEACRQASSSLTVPRARLSAEVSWLPGVSPGKAAAAVDALGAGRDTSGFPPLARANLLAARLASESPTDLVGKILELAEVADGVEIDEVQRDINEDRELAGIPRVTARELVEEEVGVRRRRYREEAQNLLDGLPTSQLIEIVSRLAEVATADGTDHAWSLVEDIVSVYEAACQGFVEGETKNIDILLSRLITQTADGNGSMKDTMATLQRVLKNFGRVIRPIQLVSRSKGVDHPASEQLARQIRSTAIDLYNDYNLLDASNDLTKILRENFGLLTEFSERVSEDSKTLEGFVEARAEAKKNAAKWEESLSYSADIGALFSQKLEISAQGGIRWAGQVIRFEEITSISWGGTRHSVNGVPTGTTFDIYIGSGMSPMHIRTRKREVYGETVDRLWRGAGVRLAMELARRVRGTGFVQFKDLVLRDLGVTIRKRHVFAKDEDIYLTWDKVHVWNSNGAFCIGDRNDKRTSVALSSMNEANVVVLEEMIRAFFKSGKPNLSSLAD